MEEKHCKLAEGSELCCTHSSGKKKFDHITPSLRQLNWLPLNYMLRFRDTVMAFKCISGLAPSYLCRMLETRSQVAT